MRVETKTYIDYINNYLGGIPAVIVHNLILISFASAKVYCDYLVGAWAYSSD